VPVDIWPPEAIKLFKKTGAYLVPTLLASETVVQLAQHSDFMSDAIKKKAITTGAAMQGNFEKSYKVGVKIAGCGFAGSRHRRAVNSHNSRTPSLPAWPATWNARACWNVLATTSTSPHKPWITQMKIRRINCLEVPLPTALPRDHSKGAMCIEDIDAPDLS
jgi:hypothetical protein